MADERGEQGAVETPDSPRTSPPAPDAEAKSRVEQRRDELIEEGILVSMAALRMKVKNRTIVWMLRDGKPWDDDAVRAMVRDEVAALTAELNREADRLAELRPKAARRIGRSQHQYDYGQEDVYLLRQRENTNRSVAERLTALADDSEKVDAVVAGVKHDNLMDIVGAAPLPFEPRPSDVVDPEQQRRAIRAIENELQVMLAKAEGRPLVVPNAKRMPARDGAGATSPSRPWWKRLRQSR